MIETRFFLCRSCLKSRCLDLTAVPPTIIVRKRRRRRRRRKRHIIHVDNGHHLMKLALGIRFLAKYPRESCVYRGRYCASQSKIAVSASRRYTQHAAYVSCVVDPQQSHADQIRDRKSAAYLPPRQSLCSKRVAIILANCAPSLHAYAS